MFEVLLRCSQDDAEAVSDALMDELDALSASVEDADANTDAENALFGEPGMPAPRAGWQRSLVKALFADKSGAVLAVDALLDHEWAGEVEVEAITEVVDQDWVRLTQAQFQPVAVTPSFWIVPSWHDAPAEARKVIRLDPGMAFGTGTHPTTRMCLRWIARHADERAARWTRVLDYGCGSGILAIGAALHGASGIDAVDIDPAAVQATRDNAVANAVELQCGDAELAQGLYPLVLANILATPLRLLAPVLIGHMAPGGDLVLAGILERQADELIEAYAPDLRLAVTDSEDGWILMTGQLGDTQRMA
jgi:ribosomal protein L11 methyltransferase